MSVTKKQFEEAMKQAQLNIADFEPASSLPASSNGASQGEVTVDIQAAKGEFAAKAASELTAALFDHIKEMAKDGAKSEIDTQQIIQKLSNLETQLQAIQAILARNSLS